ncbi:hypothetical protein LJB42_002359 [Komagataella kurtzmanii]|nr:hypothetical protein LJB42_002359 [Komagataella kurtzmanii]
MTKREARKTEGPKKLAKQIHVSYEGYTVSASSSIEIMDVNELDWNLMYSRFVSQRKPCLIDGVMPGLNLNIFQPHLLNELLDYGEVLEVEQKINGGFGSNVQRLQMRFEELMENLRTGKGDLYLTTQYGGEDENDERKEEEEEGNIENSGTEGFDDNSDTETCSLVSLSTSFHDDFEDLDDLDDLEKPRLFIQPPLCNLSSSILPSSPSFLDKLAIQQVNLWLGSARPTPLALDPLKTDLGVGNCVPNGTSSGLHHDHADNLYIPIHGRKRFTLFSPQDAPNLYTQGNIATIYENGVVDYITNKNAPNWRHIRDDGAIIGEVCRWKLEQQSDSLSETQQKLLLEQIKEEDKLLASFSSVPKVEPPSFSRIPPALLHIQEVESVEDRARLHKLSQNGYPLLSKCHSLIVDLEPGQMLYLPAGWFHEVKSYGEEEESPEFPYVHEAINYWFEPPNGSTSDRPYEDSYWSEISPYQLN